MVDESLSPVVVLLDGLRLLVGRRKFHHRPDECPEHHDFDEDCQLRAVAHVQQKETRREDNGGHDGDPVLLEELHERFHVVSSVFGWDSDVNY